MLRKRLHWTIRITDSCAQTCMTRFDLDTVDTARAFLTHTLAQRGTLVDSLPPRFHDPQSPSGNFALVDGLFAVVLVEDSTKPRQWVATTCLPDPRHQPRPDTPTPATPARRVELSGHAIAQFQHSCGGHPDTVIAAAQLRSLLDRTARIATAPPRWSCTEKPTDLLLTVGEHQEYLIPCRRRRNGGYTATTVVMRDGDLFDLDARGLLGRCRIDDAAVPAGSVTARRFDGLMRTGVRLVR